MKKASLGKSLHYDWKKQLLKSANYVDCKKPPNWAGIMNPFYGFSSYEKKMQILDDARLRRRQAGKARPHGAPKDTNLDISDIKQD